MRVHLINKVSQCPEDATSRVFSLLKVPTNWARVDTFNTVKTLWTFVDSSIAGGADPAAVRAAAAGAPPQPTPRRPRRLQADQGRDAARRHQGDSADHPESVQHLNPEPVNKTW